MPSEALIVIDVQKDFCPGGALPVPDGNLVLAECNRQMRAAELVVLTQDWHPPDHISFAKKHGLPAYQTIELDYGTQVLWPTHCVQLTAGSEFHPDLSDELAQLIIRKGTHAGVDSYSGFFENDHKTSTGLGGALRELGVESIVLVGLATDFCVKYTALDGRALGFEVTVIREGCRGIDIDGSLDAAWEEMAHAGVRIR